MSHASFADVVPLTQLCRLIYSSLFTNEW